MSIDPGITVRSMEIGSRAPRARRSACLMHVSRVEVSETVTKCARVISFNYTNCIHAFGNSLTRSP